MNTETTNTTTIHWLGAGLSSLPGIKRLSRIQSDNHAKLIVWNRSLDKAKNLLADIANNTDILALDWDNLKHTVQPGDIVVSMLPATWHLQVAKLCLDKKAHFVSSSYISPEMAELDQQARQLNLCFVNEVGLDPGIDHLLAHKLVADYQASAQFNPQHKHYFRSYCGGFPAIANDFKYKFSWSPLGVLKALRSEAKWIGEHQGQGQIKTANAPWQALSDYQANFAGKTETFQAYPNRDSTPFKRQYHFGDDWQINEFVRGTLRLAGWSQAWQDIFTQVDKLQGPQGEQALAELSETLEQQYSYQPGEPDRVVLCVELEVKDNEQSVWHQSYQLNAHGNQHGQAMSRTVSLTVSIAIESILKNQLPKGVSAAPDDIAIVNQWIQQLQDLGEEIGHHDYLE